jgi:hypothetical protein
MHVPPRGLTNRWRQPRAAARQVSIAVLAVLFGTASLVHARSLASAPSVAKLRDWASPDCINAGKYVGIDYARALERAINKEPAGLAELFRFTDTAGYDGGAGEGHSAILLGLLQRWGDRSFAHVLRAQPSRIRREVIDAINYVLPDPGLKHSPFHETYSLAPH